MSYGVGGADERAQLIDNGAAEAPPQNASWHEGQPSPREMGQETLAWTNINFHIQTGGGCCGRGESGTKTILDAVSGSIKAGRLTAVMGPSGSGKSSLLNILAGRMRGGGKKTVDGSMSFKGRTIDPAQFRTQIAYVMQEDALFATSTAFEALDFSAAMRLPDTVSAEERHERCERMLAVLGLTRQRDVYVGSKTVAGLSGGQKKRLACGVELITDPAIVFLDEPTSGLDSYAALQLCTVLRRLARGHTVGEDVDLDDPEAAFGAAAAQDGMAARATRLSAIEGLNPRSVVCTIHQPSSEVFELFDDVILLGQGGIVYCGPRTEMASVNGGDFFSSLGYPCPAEHNPADHVMFKLQIKGCRATPEAWKQWISAKQSQEDTKRQYSGLLAASFDTAVVRAKAGICRQFQYLGLRELRNVKRDKTQMIARFGTTTFIMLLVGIVFKGVGGKKPDDSLNPEGVIRDHFGALSQISIAAMFGISQPVLLNFPLERPIFLREYAAGTYGTFPYIVSKLLVDTPLAIGQAAWMFLIAYWLLELQGNFAYLTLACALIGLAAGGLALIIGSVASEPTTAVQLSPLLFVPQFLFAGFFVATSQIPSWIRWAQYLCTLKYGLNLLAIAEFKEDGNIFAENLYDQMDIKTDQKWVYFGIMMAFFVGLRLLAMVILARRSRNPVS